ncbi:DUF6912 family protein [Angustibacter aerolatus]
MRVYVATTTDGLTRLRDGGLPLPLVACAVTPALREWYTEGDEEELEYAAASDAALASLRLLADDGAARPRSRTSADAQTGGHPLRRVVLAVEVPDGEVGTRGRDPHADDRSAVELARGVTRDDVVSVHLDDDLALDDVAAAVRALPAADAGDEDAQAVVDDAEGHELLWFDVTELDDLVDR